MQETLASTTVSVKAESQRQESGHNQHDECEVIDRIPDKPQERL